MNTLNLAQKRVKLKKVSNTNGGEWQGPCPACGGEDRFHVWPNQNETKGAYWCRSCGKTGDNIQFLRDFEGLSFRDACAELGINLPPGHDPNAEHLGSCPKQEKPIFQPITHASPADLWQERAEKFVAWAQSGLTVNESILTWLAARGINANIARNYRLGWNDGEKGGDIYRPRQSWGLDEILKDNGKPKMLCIPRGLVIPYIVDGIIYRVKIRRPAEHRTEKWPAPYYVLPGSAMSTMILEPDRRGFVIVESELDAITVVAAQDIFGAVGLGSATTRPDAEAFAILKDSLQILNALDYDHAGNAASSWWQDNFENCDRWPVPPPAKDPGELFQMGIDLKKWMLAKAVPALTIVATGHDPYAKHPGSCPRAVEPNADQLAAPGKVIAEKTPDHIRDAGNMVPSLPKDVRELLTLLRNNAGVKIINQPDRYTVLRQGKYVGGRINELVFHSPEVMAYIVNHPAAEIDGLNLVSWEQVS